MDITFCKDKMPLGNAINASKFSNIHDMRCCIVETLNSMPTVRLEVFPFFKAMLKTLLSLIIVVLATHPCKPWTPPPYTR